MKLAEPKNPNYAATVVALSKFVDLPNCDNVKAALIFGNSVIVGKDAQEGELGLFFPVETALSNEFLSNNNLYRKPKWGNIDIDKKGFFEQHGRVKAVKFRGHKSEGFFISLNSLDYICNTGADSLMLVGSVFDTIGDHEICHKYVPKVNPTGTRHIRGRQPRLEDKIVEKQFRFHYDTENLRRNIHKINPTDWISITDKWHGTSVVIANVLVNRDLKWHEKILKRLGVKIQSTEYGLAYSSRRVLKEVNGESKTNLHFYNEDIWGIVANEVKDIIPKGVTLYGEIVGYTPEGSPIQKGYHYGCPIGGHRFLVYRITITNLDGSGVVELSHLQMKEFCTKYDLETVREKWYGSVAEYFHDRANEDYWSDYDDPNQRLLELLEREYIHDQMCHFNNNEVPAEGIVVKVEHLEQSESFKLKNFKFLEWESKELDKGEVDIETAESQDEWVNKFHVNNPGKKVIQWI